MKAAGAGAAIAGIGWATAGANEEEEVDEHTDGSVHTVTTQVSASTNENRPADFFYQPTGLHVEPGDVVRWRFVTPDHNVVGMHPAFGMQRRVPLGVDAFSSPLLGYEPDSIPGDMVDPPALAGEGDGEDDAGEEATTETATEAGTATEATTATEAGTDETSAPETTPPEGSGPEPDSWLLAFETPGVYDIICSPHEVFGMAMRIVVGDETDAPFETEDPGALPEPRAGPVGLARITLTDPALAPQNIVDAGTVAWAELEANQPSDGDGGDGTDDGNGTDDGGTGEDEESGPAGEDDESYS